MVQRLLGIDFTAEERAAMGREIAAFFEDERGEALGALACERLTDFLRKNWRRWLIIRNLMRRAHGSRQNRRRCCWILVHCIGMFKESGSHPD